MSHVPATRLTALMLVVAALICSPPASVQAQDDASQDVPEGYTLGETVTLGAGITESVSEIMARDAMLPHGALAVREKPEPQRLVDKRPNPLAPLIPSWPPTPEGRSEVPALLRAPGLSPQVVGTTFLAMRLSESGFIPPDSNGDVGPTQILAVANGRIKVFDKSGVLGGLNTTTENFFASVGGLANGTSDPHVRYDRLSQRWFVVILDLAACPNNVLLAVSSGPTIASQSSFTFFSFVGEANTFTDYPTLGVDRFALYIGGNMFNVAQVGCPGNSVNTTAWVVRKADLINNILTVTAFRGLADFNSGVGIWTPQGVHNDDPSATEGYFVGIDFFVFGQMGIRRISNPGGTPTISPQITLTTPSEVFPIDQVQPSPGPLLDALDDRHFAAMMKRNKITNTSTLWTAHNIEVTSGGVGQTGGGRNGSRWYEIGNLTTSPTILQSGTLFDPAGTTPFGFWIPSVAMSGQGHMALGSSRASANATGGHASIAAAGRLRTDAAGTIQAATLAQASTFTYNVGGGTAKRWGDYSQVGVDPNDDQTMWTFQEYADAANSWAVRAIQLRAPLPATPASASPASVAGGQASVNTTITGTSASGSEFFDPGLDTGGPGFPNHIAGAVSGGVVVNSATFASITQVTLNLNTVGVTPGTKNVTITNPDGQIATGNNILTVTCQAIGINPATIPTGTVNTLYPAQVFTHTGGLGSVAVGMTGTLPTGMIFTDVTDTLSGTPTQAGTFPITVTATDQNGCQGTRDYNLVIGCNQTITVNPATIPSGRVGTAYGQTFTQTGGVGPTTFSLAGTLPTGLNFATPTLSGNPSQAGSFPIVVSAIDSTTCRRDKPYTLVVTSSAGTGPVALAVNAAGNGVFDNAETGVTMAPSWFNNSGGPVAPRSPLALTGTLTNPVGGGLSIGADTTGGYGTIADGGTNPCSDCYTTMSNTGAPPPRHLDATVTETPSTGSAKSWTLHIGGSFDDVATSNQFYSFIETIFHRGVTSGCSATSYCPANQTLRKQMARFLLRAKLGGSYTSPAPSGTIFDDVPVNHPFAADIEDLVSRKVTSGCSSSPPLYCPDNSVTRRQMAPFLLRALEGSAYVPPACVTPPFADVPTNDAFCPHIQELAVRQITLGCGGGNYCPSDPVTRGQMAAFLQRTFGMLLYGPF